MKTFTVIAADIITKQGVEPFVGLTIIVNGKQEQIARTCKQALLDLHKSARASNIPSGLYDNGVDSANPIMHNLFREAIIGLVNKTGFADVEFYEAGAEYVATEVSSAVLRGEAEVGQILFTEKKGSRIEGFVTFPLTDLEQAQKAFLASANPLIIMQGLFGIGAPAVAPVVAETPQAIVAPAQPVATATAFEAFEAPEEEETSEENLEPVAEPEVASPATAKTGTTKAK